MFIINDYTILVSYNVRSFGTVPHSKHLVLSRLVSAMAFNASDVKMSDIRCIKRWEKK